MRLDKFLTGKLKGLSRNRIQQFIKAGKIKVNGREITKASFEISQNDRVDIPDNVILNEVKNPIIKPDSNIALDIIYEDKDIVVINKPAGLLTHPTTSQLNHTLVNALLAKYPEIENVGENPLRPGIVHRLDKDTSGLLVVAKNQKAFLFIKQQFLNRSVSKKYLALVEGVPKEKQGVIDFPIRPSKKMRLKKVAMKKEAPTKASHRAAKTEYKIKEILRQTQDKSYSLLEVSPLTGRTHQIRVHLSAIGHPVVGDKLYGSKTPAKRQFLHAYSLELTAPSGTSLSLKADLPEDLKEILSSLRV